MDNVRKVYADTRTSRARLGHVVKTAVGRGERPHSPGAVTALNEINITVRPGESVGIVGRNGSGKSTLLRLISGRFRPTEGSIQWNGKLHSIFPGSVAFNPMLSGRVNAFIYLQESGLTAEVSRACLEEVLDFAQLAEYADQPLATYSLGMKTRLEFAAATAVPSDLLVVDEVLGSGDQFWLERAADRIETLKQGGCSLLLVSHSLDQIRRFCDRALWLENGCVAADGQMEEVIRVYETYLEWLGTRPEEVAALSKPTDIGRDMLPSIGPVLRWPGSRTVSVEDIQFSNEPQSIDTPVGLGIALHYSTPHTLTTWVALTLWSSDGRRFAVTEALLNLPAATNNSFVLSVLCPTASLPPDRYEINVTISAFEGDRQGEIFDRIYRSVTMTVNEGRTVVLTPTSIDG